jgi:hypothetical protein
VSFLNNVIFIKTNVHLSETYGYLAILSRPFGCLVYSSIYNIRAIYYNVVLWMLLSPLYHGGQYYRLRKQEYLEKITELQTLSHKVLFGIP